ncbi:sigma-70 family RNA polymerase sigma factor [bacterium]|nr:sigma-70 family RNA polymerase sigma factor [bacterium]
MQREKTISDAELVKKFNSGDINAFTTLVNRWESHVYNFVLRNVGNRETAKDICQILFLRIFEKLHKIKDPGKFKQWIFKIAVNLCRDEYKRRKTRSTYFVSGSSHDDSISMYTDRISDKSPSPEQAFDNKLLINILSEALLELPEDQRVVIIMKQYHNLKFTEIAEITKTSENTVKSRLYYGLKTLKKVLEQQELSREVLINEM